MSSSKCNPDQAPQHMVSAYNVQASCTMLSGRVHPRKTSEGYVMALEILYGGSQLTATFQTWPSYNGISDISVDPDAGVDLFGSTPFAHS